MKIISLGNDFSVTGQITADDVERLAEMGYGTIINNRPDDESEDQPNSADLGQLAESLGMQYLHLPITPNQFPVESVTAFDDFLSNCKTPVLAFCRTGNRSSKLYELRQALPGRAAPTIAKAAPKHVQVLIVGGGAGGSATAASILKRDPNVEIAIVEPHDEHYYQPGWTMVGGGVFTTDMTVRPMRDVIPSRVEWIKDAVTDFYPELSEVKLQDGACIHYDVLVVSAGIKLDWEQISGLTDTLGKNGVTSNYHISHAPYTWKLVQALKQGKAIFTQPPMPIKCAGAPQKALYLSADYWLKQGRLGDVNVAFYNAGGVLFGVDAYVPALQSYMDKYQAELNFGQNLVAVDGPKQIATFESAEGVKTEVPFDFLHVTPPQTSPDFIRNSALVNEAGWVDVDDETLQHKRFNNIFSLGDVCSTPNAKTAAAVRKQAPVVAHNVLAILANEASVAYYDGYGSCPLTVERGKVVLAEFTYGGKLSPSAPEWLLNGTVPTWLGWFLKAYLLRPIYFDLMLKGREWLASPRVEPGEKLAADGVAEVGK